MTDRAAPRVLRHDDREAFSSSPERGRSFRHETRSGPRRGGWNREESRRAPEQDRVQGEELSHSVDQQPDDMLWGRHATQAALETGRPIHRVWCTAEVRSSPKFLQLLRDAKASGVLVEEVTWARLGQLTGGAVHQGIALQTASADTLDLPSLVEGCAALGEPPLLLALDGVTDPHNLGAVVRSAEALGAHGVVLPQRRSAGLTGSVAKVAAGALEHLPVARVVNLNRSLETTATRGQALVGTHANVFLTPRLRAFGRADLGGFGITGRDDLSGNAQLGLGYAVGNSTSLNLSWRYRFISISNSNDPKTGYTSYQNGLEMGVKFFF